MAAAVQTLPQPHHSGLEGLPGVRDWLLLCLMVHKGENARTRTRTETIAGTRRWKAMNKRQKRLAGLTLTELLCVIAIITILASLYFPVILKAFTRVRTFLNGS